jgi:hypothetical protein
MSTWRHINELLGRTLAAVSDRCGGQGVTIFLAWSSRSAHRRWEDGRACGRVWLSSQSTWIRIGFAR